METRLRRELKDKNFIILLVSGIILASALTYWLLSVTNNQQTIIEEVKTIAKKVNNTQITVVIPENATVTGKISSALGSGPVVVNLSK